jgi:uncharacterized protein (TIGR02246 family)
MMRESWSSFGRVSVLVGVVLVLGAAGLDATRFGASPLAANEDEPGRSAQPTSREAEEAAVRSLVTQGSDAWNRGDAAGLAALWAENGELVAGDGVYCNGRPEIAKYFTRLLTGSWKGSRFVASVTSVRFPRPDVALMHLDSGFVLAGETEPAPDRRAVQSLVAVRNGSTWRLALYHSTRTRPPSQPPSS